MATKTSPDTTDQGNSLDVGIIGFGVVGKATAKGFKSLGHTIYINDVLDLSQFQGQYNVLVPYDPIKTELTTLTLPTPTRPAPELGGRIDTSVLDQVVEELGRKIKTSDKYHLISVRSTVPPGTTEGLARKLEKASGKELGRHFGIAMNPEFLRAFNSEYDFQHPVMTVLGVYDARGASLMQRLYSGIPSEVALVRPEEAEAIKYSHNLHNAAKISYWNELFLMSKQLHIDFEALRQAVVQSMRLPNARPLDAPIAESTAKFYSFAKSRGFKPTISKAVMNYLGLENAQNGINPTFESAVSYASDMGRLVQKTFWEEMKSSFRRIGGIDGEKVHQTVAVTSESHWNPEYGTHGGRAYGGTCLPKDTTAYHSYMADRQMDMPFLASVIRINEEMEKRKPEDNARAREYHSQRKHVTYNNLS